MSNESAEIVRMFNSAFDGVGANDNDYYPAEPARRDRRAERAASIRTSTTASTARASRRRRTRTRKPSTPLFAALDELEGRLSDAPLSHGNAAHRSRHSAVHDADPLRSRVLTATSSATCAAIVDYPNLWGFLRDVYQSPGIAETVHVDFIKRHYYGSHANLNPSRIVPIGPELNYETPHGRERLAH